MGQFIAPLSCGVYETENSISTVHAYQGSKSLCIPCGSNAISETVSIPAGETYTFSAYVKTEGCRAVLTLGDATSTELAENADWTRLEVSYTNTDTEALTAVAGVQIQAEGTGNAYVRDKGTVLLSPLLVGG